MKFRGRDSRRDRLIRAALILSITVFGLSLAGSATLNAGAAQSGNKHRIGGKVKKAWPRTGNAPKTQLAKWLARQVGPVRECGKKRTTGPKRARIKHNRKRRRCLRWHRKIRVSASSSAVTAAGDPGAPAFRSSHPRVSVSASADSSPTLLVRSFQIPKDDPDYERLLNWSWTYDSAVTAAAFVSLKEEDQARQLLDQLAAMQFDTGSIDIAFNVATGAGAGQYRAGTVAWLGFAAASFDATFSSDRYLQTARLAYDWLKGQRGPEGLVRGGPGLDWYSTLHNLMAYSFIMRLAASDPDRKRTSGYVTVAKKISTAIKANLMVDDETGLHFRQGLNDDVEPLDVQTVGALYLAGLGEDSNAQKVVDRIPDHFSVKDQKIELSDKLNSYNMTWSSKDKFEGFKPYDSKEIPDVIWFEGTAQVRAATAATGGNVKDLDQAAQEWRDVTEKGGSSAPLQANETVADTSPEGIGVEYHVWPAAAGAAWWVLASQDPEFLRTQLIVTRSPGI